MGLCLSWLNASTAAPSETIRLSDTKTLSVSGPLSTLVQRIRDGEIRRIILCVGAGISVSAGIPDFRTPGSGLYSNLQKYNLPYAEAVFDIRYFSENPDAFCMLAKEMWPSQYKPTKAHKFIRLLQDKGMLHRCYTQNIDTLEREAGITDNLTVEAHGSFSGASCISCRKQFTTEWTREKIFQGVIPRCDRRQGVLPLTPCGGLVKPNIVFFGEQLPEKFHNSCVSDFGSRTNGADLMIVAGTSLQVQPFADVALGARCPRILINREIPKTFKPTSKDVTVLGDCDDGFSYLATLLGWESDLAEMHGSDDA